MRQTNGTDHNGRRCCGWALVAWLVGCGVACGCAEPTLEHSRGPVDDTAQAGATDTGAAPIETEDSASQSANDSFGTVPADTGTADPGTGVDTGVTDPGTGLDTGVTDPSTGVDTGADTGVDTGSADHTHLPGFLHVEGGRLLDGDGNEVRMTGVNWFGFETSNRAPHGLWSRDYRSMLKQVRALGFNTLRLPWSNAILDEGAAASSINYSGADAYDGTNPMNGELQGKSPLEVLDAIVAEAKQLGLMVVLDNHSRAPDGYMGETVWYTGAFSEEQWISDWQELALRYRSEPTVVGFDLDNEPHGDASWGTGNAATDWNSAAERCGNALLAVHPDALIIVEGVERYAGESHWWGGNLTGAAEHPIVLSDPSKLVYSPHEYGPEVFQQTWFSDPSFPANMQAIWRKRFGFLMEAGSGHLLVGEFGIKDAAAYGGKSGIWLETFLAYLGSKVSWTFWCMNPNSGDTGGILQDDWVSVNEWKMDYLRPHLFK